MTEDVAISFATEELQTLTERKIPPGLADEVREDLAVLGVPSSEVRLETGSAGYGAEVMTLLVILAGAFFLGKKIDENLSAWVSVGGRVRRIVDRFAKKYGSVAVSEPAALMLALEEMRERGIPLEGVHLIASHTLPVAKGLRPAELVDDFRYQPDRFYVFVLCTDNQDHFLVCLRSSGTLEEILHLPTGDWVEYWRIRSASESDDQSA